MTVTLVIPPVPLVLAQALSIKDKMTANDTKTVVFFHSISPLYDLQTNSEFFVYLSRVMRFLK